MDWPADDWWTVYQDPQLNALMAEALQGSPDLKAAEARVRQAGGAAEQAGAARLPNLSANTAAYEAQIAESLGLPPAVSQALPKGFEILTQSGANLRYTLDFFGRNRAALASATSLAEAARADRAAARLELTVDVADAYADFVRLTQDRDEALEAVRVRRDTLKLVAARRANGLETRGEYSQQNATVSTAQGLVDALDLQILQTRHQIAALVGAGPDRGLQIEAPARRTAYLRPSGLPTSLSLDLVGRRPDIVAARLRAEAARQRIKVARAGFYPNVDLAGSFLAFSVANQNPLKNSVSLAELGPAITLPIFTGGQTEGAYRSARADYDQAAALYGSTLAKALRDVADALAGQRALQTQIKDARDALTADEDAYAIAKLRYEGGLSPYLVVLTAESAVLQQRQTVVNLSVQSLTSDLALVRALGGGYVQAVASNSSH